MGANRVPVPTEEVEFRGRGSSNIAMIDSLELCAATGELSRVELTLKTSRDELQDRYARNGMAGAIRAAYNEAP